MNAFAARGLALAIGSAGKRIAYRMRDAAEALVSRTLREEAMRAKLRSNSDPAALHAVLTESRTTHAA